MAICIYNELNINIILRVFKGVHNNTCRDLVACEVRMPHHIPHLGINLGLYRDFTLESVGLPRVPFPLPDAQSLVPVGDCSFPACAVWSGLRCGSCSWTPVSLRMGLCTIAEIRTMEVSSKCLTGWVLQLQSKLPTRLSLKCCRRCRPDRPLRVPSVLGRAAGVTAWSLHGVF